MSFTPCKLSCEGFNVILGQVLPEFNQDDGCHMSQLVLRLLPSSSTFSRAFCTD